MSCPPPADHRSASHLGSAPCCAALYWLQTASSLCGLQGMWAAQLTKGLLQDLYQVFHSMAQLRLAPGRTVARKYKEAVAATTAADPSAVHFMLVRAWR